MPFADRNHAKLYNRLTDCVKQLAAWAINLGRNFVAFGVNLPPDKP
jgi:hypothetical protein